VASRRFSNVYVSEDSNEHARTFRRENLPRWVQSLHVCNPATRGFVTFFPLLPQSLFRQILVGLRFLSISSIRICEVVAAYYFPGKLRISCTYTLVARKIIC
jgi:hypothetical protein